MENINLMGIKQKLYGIVWEINAMPVTITHHPSPGSAQLKPVGSTRWNPIHINITPRPEPKKKNQKEMPPNLSTLLFFLLLLLLLFSLRSAASSPETGDPKTFLVIVDPQTKPYPFNSHIDWYSYLISSSSSSKIHTLYETLIHGFAATLTLTLALEIEKSSGVLSVCEDYTLQPHTTRSPSFLNLDPPLSILSNLSKMGSDSIIGVVDTGIWPESPSFSDHEFGPIPAKWSGKCEIGERFNGSNCNRKLIGARYFSAGYAAAFGLPAGDEVEFFSARDSDGHGTHVASIAAGSPVTGANFDGFAGGIARGMAPKARIAVYKVCWSSGCLVSDVVSAIEKAVSDGVDVISLSLGSSSPTKFYYLDPLAIATFRATMKGVFIAASAGNGGPRLGSVGNSLPWITTVGAETIDRDFPAIVRLGSSKSLRGISISIAPHRSLRGNLTAAFLPNTTIDDRIAFAESDRHVSRIEMGAALKSAGAEGMIIFHGDVDPTGLVAEPHEIPTIAVPSAVAISVKKYMESSKNPTAVISSKGTDLLPRTTSRILASFSSRGPNPVVPVVLKPDLVGPGVNILGAWTAAIAPSGIRSDTRRSRFNIMSGTSMACPHVSGVAALLRGAHPEWGPSEIRSALMTTAVTSPVTDDPFGFGSGYMDPNGAADPGLVYDLDYEDYAGLLCGLGYGEREIKAVSGRGGFLCGRFGGKGALGFNYPGFVVRDDDFLAGNGEVAMHRRVKRVGGFRGRGTLYRAELEGVEGYGVVVEPTRLWFDGRVVGEWVEFRLVLRRVESRKKKGVSWGMLRWREEKGRHSVGSPIVVFSEDII